MFSTLHKRIAANRGFTLIELLVVILILGILAAIALPAFTDQGQKKNDRAVIDNLLAARQTMGYYYQDNMTYVGANHETLIQYNELDPEQDLYFLIIEKTTLASYTLSYISTGKTETDFTFTSDGNNDKMSCNHPGVGLCKENGTWSWDDK